MEGMEAVQPDGCSGSEAAAPRRRETGYMGDLRRLARYTPAPSLLDDPEQF